MTKDCPSKNSAPPLPAYRHFDEVFAEFRLTARERRELVYRLAALRAQRTIEALLPQADLSDFGLRSPPRHSVGTE